MGWETTLAAGGPFSVEDRDGRHSAGDVVVSVGASAPAELASVDRVILHYMRHRPPIPCVLSPWPAATRRAKGKGLGVG